MAKHRSEVDASTELAKTLKASNANALSAMAASFGDVQSDGATLVKLACASVAFGNMSIKNPKLKFEDVVWGPFADNYYGDDKMDKRRMLDRKPKTKADIEKKCKQYAHFVTCGSHAKWPLKDRERVGAAVIGAYALNAGGLTVKAALLGSIIENNAENAPSQKDVDAAIAERASRKPDTTFDVTQGLKRMASTAAAWFATEKDAKDFWKSFASVRTEGKQKGQPLLNDRAKALTITLITTLRELGLAVSNSTELKAALTKAQTSMEVNVKLYDKALKANTPNRA